MIIHEVEQGTEEWHALRAGKPTASEFSKLVTSTGELSKSMAEYAVQLAADHYVGKPVDRWEGNQWSDRGHEMEDRARAAYELNHPDRAVKQVGFITDDDQIVGASPDSIVVDGNKQGGLEIKCLKATTHINAIMYFKKNKVMPTKYVQQTQGQMYVGDLEFNDLYFWHPELPDLEIRTFPNKIFLYGGETDKGKPIIGLVKQLSNCIAERNRIVRELKAG